MKRLYLDSSATTKVYPEVIKAMKPYFKKMWGNPSSIYEEGRIAKNTILKAKERISKILNCSPNEIYFTSGGSESDNIIIKGCVPTESSFITSAIEHPAVRNACKSIRSRGSLQITVAPNKNGIISVDKFKEIEALIKEEKPSLASIMLVNNELGSINPINEISQYLKTIVPNIIIHTDAVQAAGKVSLDVQKLGVDSLSLSGHKFGAPKGIGILYLKNGIKCSALIDGGGQENGLRSGTENVPYIVGITKALELTYNNFDKKIKKLKISQQEFINDISTIPLAKINNVESSCGIINVSFKGIDAQNLLLYLDSKGISVSAGSACHSDSNTPSYVLKAIGLTDEEALSSLRISFCSALTRSQRKRFINTLIDGINKQLKFNS